MIDFNLFFLYVFNHLVNSRMKLTKELCCTFTFMLNVFILMSLPGVLQTTLKQSFATKVISKFCHKNLRPSKLKRY